MLVGVDVRVCHGLPVLSIPLPSRQERCQFTLRPISNTLGDLVQSLQVEDKGIDRVVAFAQGQSPYVLNAALDIEKYPLQMGKG
jgi:hypothetical protein